MTATAWKGETYGVRVGKTNAVNFFGDDWKTVEIELDGEFHRFRLSKTFWTTCPEVRGRAIKQWLFRRGLAPWPQGKPPQLVLTPLGENRFRLSTAVRGKGCAHGSSDFEDTKARLA